MLKLLTQEHQQKILREQFQNETKIVYETLVFTETYLNCSLKEQNSTAGKKKVGGIEFIWISVQMFL